MANPLGNRITAPPHVTWRLENHPTDSAPRYPAATTPASDGYSWPIYAPMLTNLINRLSWRRDLQGRLWSSRVVTLLLSSCLAPPRLVYPFVSIVALFFAFPLPTTYKAPALPQNSPTSLSLLPHSPCLLTRTEKKRCTSLPLPSPLLPPPSARPQPPALLHAP